jgi:exosortase C (VPDSG-CTERM-specific)
LSLVIFSYVALIGGAAAWFLGRDVFRGAGFPLAFLVFLVPLPAPITAGLESLLQHASAATAGVCFQLSDLPVFQRGDLEFQLPGITIEVAPECSGIQSSMALFIVSLAAGYVFLRSPWRRAVLSFAVVPLGIARNAVRILTIAELCVHIGPEMIDSYIHHHGGWIFFLASLVPFLALLFLLVRSDRSPSKESDQTKGVACQS